MAYYIGVVGGFILHNARQGAGGEGLPIVVCGCSARVSEWERG